MTAREHLMRYRRIDREIDCLMSERRRVRALMYQTGGGQGGSTRGRKQQSDASYTGLVHKCIEIERALDERIDALIDAETAISDTLDRLDDAKLRTLLFVRYLSRGRHDWRYIAARIGCSEVNARCNLHRAALREVEKIITTIYCGRD